MKRKTILVFLIIASLIIIAFILNASFNERSNMQKVAKVKVVHEIPQGFVHLGNENMENGLRFIFFESLINFVDGEDVPIYSTMLDNSNFIVEYRKEYYINNEKLSELIEIAVIAPEIRRKTFSIGEDIQIRGAEGIVYTVRIISVNAVKTNDITTYTIKYSAPDSVFSDKRINFNFIVLAETKDGVRGSMFDFIDSETVTIEIPKNRELGAIFLISPEYSGLTYRVVVNE